MSECRCQLGLTQQLSQQFRFDMEKHKVGPRSISKSPIRSPRRVTPPPLVARVRVAVRVRPPLSTDEPPQLCIAQAEADSTTGSSDNMLHFQLEKTQKCFRFDHVFLSTAKQIEVYNAALQPLLASLLHGFNVTVLAYGQTGSGKTYTMGGATRLETAFDSSEGLIPHFLRDLFEALRNEASMKTTAKVSFLEIYCDEIRDLLVADGDTTRSTAHNNPRQNSATRLTIHEDDQDVWVEELNQVKVKNVGEAVNLLKAGRQRQTIGAHALNDHSSRSHAVYTLEVSRVFADEVKRAKLTFVDLAGSERVKKTLMEGQGMKEGSHINIGLLALGNVINALGSKQRILQRRNSTGVSGRRSSISASDNITPLGPAHVPYRSSKLTRLLRDALGGNSVTLFIACISPDATNGNETLCTLQYANRARSIQNKAHKNVEEAVPEDITDDEASVQHGTESEREIYALREQVAALKLKLEEAVAQAKTAEARISLSTHRNPSKPKRRLRLAPLELDIPELVNIPELSQHLGTEQREGVINKSTQKRQQDSFCCSITEQPVTEGQNQHAELIRPALQGPGATAIHSESFNGIGPPQSHVQNQVSFLVNQDSSGARTGDKDSTKYDSANGPTNQRCAKTSDTLHDILKRTREFLENGPEQLSTDIKPEFGDEGLPSPLSLDEFLNRMAVLYDLQSLQQQTVHRLTQRFRHLAGLLGITDAELQMSELSKYTLVHQLGKLHQHLTAYEDLVADRLWRRLQHRESAIENYGDNWNDKLAENTYTTVYIHTVVNRIYVLHAFNEKQMHQFPIRSRILKYPATSTNDALIVPCSYYRLTCRASSVCAIKTAKSSSANVSPVERNMLVDIINQNASVHSLVSDDFSRWRRSLKGGIGNSDEEVEQGDALRRPDTTEDDAREAVLQAQNRKHFWTKRQEIPLVS
ncbi:hypothetical protein ON010_g5197 [Phytophthora cinnamomi]|nr:hypothetical protein ON010_g5197 [Phytophthora cinnamomi]